MALRIEKRIGAGVALAIAISAPLLAQSMIYEVRHQHLRGAGAGVLRISAESVSFEEKGKPQHSRVWSYGEIQQLELSSTQLRVLTYEDRKWQFGRDRDYVFERLPEDFAGEVYALLKQRLDQRFVAALADPDVRPLWQIGAKLQQRLSGSDGVLLIGEDRIVYQTKAAGGSRTWRYQDIENISSSGPFDLTVVTFEREGWRHSSGAEFRFQLKQQLTEARFNDLWSRLYRSKRGDARLFPAP